METGFHSDNYSDVKSERKVRTHAHLIEEGSG